MKRADMIVNERSEEKERQYGPFSETMTKATDIYNLMVKPRQRMESPVCMYKALVALKLSRESFAHKEDNLLDAVAYLGAMNNFIESFDGQIKNAGGAL